jgi:acyl-CoA thioester hydrolase
MALPDYRCIIRFGVPFCDVDMMQHANHASYIVWAESARGIYFNDVLGESINGANGIVLVRLEFQYECPLDYLEQVAVGCRICRVGRKSLDFAHEIWSETRNLRAARGIVTAVVYDYAAKRAKPVPEQWRERASGYEIISPDWSSINKGAE